MIQPTARAAFLAALCALSLAAPLTAASPAHADPHGQCTVNGVAPAPGADDVQGTAGDDVVECKGDVHFWIRTYGGNDKITITGGLPGAEVIKGGDGTDTIRVTGDSDGKIWGDAGNDTITTGNVAGGYIEGGDGEDTITTGDVGVDARLVTTRVAGGRGSDTITTGSVERFAGRDASVEGEGGADIIRVGSIDQLGRVSGGPGADDLEAKSVGVETYAYLNGDGGDDRISGPGNTVLTVGAGAGWVDGGVGTDTCNAEATGQGSITNCP